jgi:hypothetical protein
MDGVDVVNRRVATNPHTINLPDGRKVKSSHVCNIVIPGLPTILSGHVVPHLAMVSLIGIRPLCNVGCTVTFDKDKCDVIYDDQVILRGFKDVAMNLWTLPLSMPQRPPFNDRPLFVIVPNITSTRESIPALPWRRSHVPFEPKPMGLNFRTNHCAIQRYRRCSRLCIRDSSKGAPTCRRN